MQVYDFYSPYWRVRFADDDWEELTASDIKRLHGEGEGGGSLSLSLRLSLRFSSSPLPPGMDGRFRTCASPCVFVARVQPPCLSLRVSSTRACLLACFHVQYLRPSRAAGLGLLLATLAHSSRRGREAPSSDRSFLSLPLTLFPLCHSRSTVPVGFVSASNPASFRSRRRCHSRYVSCDWLETDASQQRMPGGSYEQVRLHAPGRRRDEG